MSGLLQIRDVPDEARHALKARAAARGESLNAFLLTVLTREATTPTVAQVLQRAASRTERATGSAVEVLAAVRADRDEQLGERAQP